MAVPVLSPTGRPLLRQNGRPALADDVSGACNCCGCFYWRATPCSRFLCTTESPPDVFICIDSYCYSGGDPIGEGSIISLRDGSLCYRVETSIVYCPRAGPFSLIGRLLATAGLAASIGPGSDCEELPEGAVTYDSNVVFCHAACVPSAGCPDIDGCFPMTPCAGDCGVGGPYWVHCSAYFESQEQGLGVWFIPGAGCWFVHPDAIPETCPEGEAIIHTIADYRDCCTCCGSNPNCCYCEMDITRYTCNGLCGAAASCTTEVLGHKRCCWDRTGYHATGSWDAMTYVPLAFGPPTPDCLLFETHCVVVGDATWHCVRTDYLFPSDVECGAVSGTTTTDFDMACECAPNFHYFAVSVHGNAAPAGDCPGGVLLLSCDTVAVDAVADSVTSGGGGTYTHIVGNVVVDGLNAICGGDGGRGLVSIPLGSGAPPAGCSGCGGGGV